MLLAVIGLVAIASGGGSGTFASFNAEVANNGNTFASGTLFLHNTANGTTCTSESAANNRNLGAGDACSFIFHIANATTATTYYKVALTNDGTLAASGLNFYTNSLCNSAADPISNGTVQGNQSGTVTSIAVSGLTYGIPTATTITINGNNFTTNGPTSPGSPSITIQSATVALTGGQAITFSPAFTGVGDGNLCTKLQFAIWEMPNGVSTDFNAGNCAYFPGCSFTGNTLDLLPATTAATNSPLTLVAGGGLNNALLSQGLDAGGGTRYFLIGIKPPSNLDNPYQSQKATVSIAWHIDQA
jgi:predicted ribosomally synthesized peptide with SipW-like signal peptide